MKKLLMCLIKFLLGKHFKIMRISLFLFFVCFFQVFATNDYAQTEKSAIQQQPVTGKVTDEGGNPLPGVNIIIKGTSTGVITDMDGNYRFEVDNPDATLLFSFIGYSTQEIVIGSQTTINITMQTETIGLDEVIAVGYASKKKANIIGSITSINGNKIASIPAADVTHAISGRLPGSVVIQECGKRPEMAY